MAKERPSGSGRVREDGRRQILLYMRPELIASLKHQAVLDGVTAYELAEEAVEALLKNRRKKKS